MMTVVYISQLFTFFPSQVPLCPESNPTQAGACTEGVSLVPLMKDPKREWKGAVFSQFPRTNIGDRKSVV